MNTMNETFNPKSLTINKLFTDADSLYQIPKYQRPYKWGDEQIDKLWDDLWESYQNDEANYFLGSVITAKPPKTNGYLDIVDGQQRLTTLLIMFAVVRDLFPSINEAICEYEPSAIGNSHLRNAIQYSEKFGRLRLFTHSNHQSDFDRLIIKGDAASHSKPLKKNIRKDEEPQFKFINTAYRLTEKFKAIGEEESGIFINYIFNKVKVIRIDCNDVGFAIKLFQVLNARGLDLTNADLTKSYLLDKLHRTYEKDIVEKKENQFLQNWVNCEKIASDTNESLNTLLVLYEYYLLAANPKQSLYEELSKQFKEKDALDVIDDFYQFCKTYKEEIYNKEYDTIIYSFFYLGWTLYWKTALITALHTNYPEYEELKLTLRNYYFKHWIAGHTLSRVKQPSFNFIKWIKAKKPINEIKREIDSLYKDNNVISRFKENITGQVYRERWLKPILFMIENKGVDRPRFLQMSDKNIHVEHILPQNYKKIYGWKHIIEDPKNGDDYVHRIGNLTLLSGKKNIQASNDAFEKKIDIYKGRGKHSDGDEKVTSFRISQKIVDEYNSNRVSKWTFESMSKRRMFFLKQIDEMLDIDLSDMEE